MTLVGVCECGNWQDDHTAADRGSSQFVYGHGACIVPGCNCTLYTWARFAEFDEDEDDA